MRNEKTRILGIGCQTHTKRNEETEKSIINILLNICMYMFVDRGQKSEKASQLSFSHSLSVNLIHLWDDFDGLERKLSIIWLSFLGSGQFKTLCGSFNSFSIILPVKSNWGGFYYKCVLNSSIIHSIVITIEKYYSCQL